MNNLCVWSKLGRDVLHVYTMRRGIKFRSIPSDNQRVRDSENEATGDGSVCGVSEHALIHRDNSVGGLAA
jgi:hypothetical protein